MATRTVSATEFKAKCLALLDDVDRGETIMVTKRGRAVAKLEPVKASAWKSLTGTWEGKVEIAGDLDAYDATPLWNALRRRKAK